MKTLNNYIINSLSSLFLSIFLPLFGIASIVFLVKLAAVTAIIQLNLLEMAKLFLFMLPELLFYTLPIAFFVSLALSLYKHSNDNEMILFFTFGIRPSNIFKILLKPALFLSILLFFNFYIITPYAKTLANNFLYQKKSEAKLNLSASELGHRFGDWLLYIGEDNKDKTYSNVVLFNKKQNEEIFIESSRAEVINDSGVSRLKLIDGEGYSYSKEKFTQIDFKEMFINDTMQNKYEAYRGAYDYWFTSEDSEGRRSKFIANILLSLFPLFGIFLAMSLGIIQARHQKSFIYLWLFLAIVAYYALAMLLQKIASFYTPALHALLWLSTTYFIYKKNILSRY